MLTNRGPAPPKLFKYLPKQFVSDLLSGVLLFRNLASFASMEDEARGDFSEGMHVDYPLRPRSISSAGSRPWRVHSVGYFPAVNRVARERVFAFCLSTELSAALAAEFGADAAVEIVDPPGLLRRVERVTKRLPKMTKAGVISGCVDYYDPLKPVEHDIGDPRELAFLKRRKFEHQREFRIACAYRDGYKHEHVILRSVDGLAELVADLKKEELRLRVGSLAGIAREVEIPPT